MKFTFEQQTIKKKNKLKNPSNKQSKPKKNFDLVTNSL